MIYQNSISLNDLIIEIMSIFSEPKCNITNEERLDCILKIVLLYKEALENHDQKTSKKIQSTRNTPK